MESTICHLQKAMQCIKVKLIYYYEHISKQHTIDLFYRQRWSVLEVGNHPRTASDGKC